MNNFRQHLHDIDGSLFKTTKTNQIKLKEDVWSGTDSNDPGVSSTVQHHYDKDTEAEVLEYLNYYFDGNLTEDTKDEDIIEAINHINMLRGSVNEYVETNNNDLEGFFVEYLENYFDGNFTEDTADEDIVEAISNLNNLCDSINEYFQL